MIADKSDSHGGCEKSPHWHDRNSIGESGAPHMPGFLFGDLPTPHREWSNDHKISEYRVEHDTMLYHHIRRHGVMPYHGDLVRSRKMKTTTLRKHAIQIGPLTRAHWHWVKMVKWNHRGVFWRGAMRAHKTSNNTSGFYESVKWLVEASANFQSELNKRTSPP